MLLDPFASSVPRFCNGVLTIVERSVVEEFLGELEGQGYMADRLELPMLDQLQATEVREEGLGLDFTQHGEEAYSRGEGAILLLDGRNE